ncbi:hypothetical protein [Nocardia sp. NPDC049149]|uniref:hypothetical protein n=1 Tax=Nocardia sp. NPDC049149 TaxID=3364315 RepID=UPI0037129194
MLKSYKDLSRWYGALEPETGAPPPILPGEASAEPLSDDGPARFPHYIRDEPPPEDVPPDLAAHRAEFTGGWSDWVGRAPGPHDDYVQRDADLVRFPWPDDDDYDDHLDERPRRSSSALRVEARARRSRRGRVFVVLVIAVLLLGAAAAGVLFLLNSTNTRAAARPVAATSSSVQFAGSAQAGVTVDSLRSRSQAGVTTHRPHGDCQTERSVSVLRSAEMGGTTTGPDAILRFQYAYYVERSGERVREVVAPDANVSPAATIQRGIDTIPAGTAHCVRIVTLADNRYSVEVTEYRPGGVPATYNKQTVTTAVVDGRTVITGITAG